MKLLDEKEMSCWAYNQCKRGNDIQEIRKLITKSFWAFLYCLYIKDIPEMWPRIKNKNAFIYCQLIKKRDEIKNNITEEKWAYFYCLYIEKDPKLIDKIFSHKWSYFYCLNIENIPQLRINVRNERKYGRKCGSRLIRTWNDKCQKYYYS